MSNLPTRAPTAMSAELAGKIITSWAAGAKYTEACMAAGLTKAEAKALKDDPDWVLAYENARNSFVASSLLNIQGHGAKDWKATAWLLERILPERFAKRETVDQNVNVTVLPFQSMLTGEVIATAEVVKTEGGVTDSRQTEKSPIVDMEREDSQ